MIHRRLLQLAGAVPGAIATLALVGVGISALHLGFAVVLALVVTAMVRGDGVSVPALAALLGLAVARGVAIWGRELLAAKIGARVRTTLRRRLLDRLAAVPAAERDSGATATTVLDGVEGLDPYFTRYLPQLLVVLVVPAAVVALVWQQSAAAGVALAITAGVAVLAPRVWDARLLRNGRTRWERLARLSSDYVEALQHIPLLRAFGAGDRTAARLARDADALRDATMSQLRLSLVETALSTFAMQAGAVLAVVAALAAVATGSAEAATAMVVLVLARECFRPVQELGANWHAGYLGLSAVDGLDRLLSTPLVPSGADDRPARRGAVDVADVAYRYPGAQTGVGGVSLRLDPGERIAIIGPSGSGKSTLARLLERELDPDHGSIRIDGVELRDFTNTARTQSLVVVPQDPVLFAWTVAENLRLYRPDADAAALEQAARVAQLHDVIAALPEGYDTVLSENGERLSGGQRQRLAIARALLSPAPVLVLDEASSALDADTERRVVEALAEATADRTVIVIAHRESACAHVTRWLAMRGGRVVDAGTGAPTGRHFTLQGVR